MNTTSMTYGNAVPRAQLAGEWLGEAALSISNWLAQVAAQRRALREADALRGHVQPLVAAQSTAAHTPR